MAESIPEKDQFLIAYPNYVLRETVTYPNGGVSRFYDDGVDMVIIDDEICSCRDGEQIFPYTLITDKQNHYMKIYRRVFRFLGFDPETIGKCLQKSRQEVLHFTKKISERGEHADSSPLELLFEQNFTDVYGMRALKYLQKEFRISDEDGNNYFLDYLVDTADSRVAIEENGIITTIAVDRNRGLSQTIAQAEYLRIVGIKAIPFFHGRLPIQGSYRG